ncbi:hypothetical protein L580_2754 [Serratia fonticola AU-P3(3)]|nr:hypothetical protein L580_2754 [Serratia fonticola AU-P3(3)]
MRRKNLGFFAILFLPGDSDAQTASQFYLSALARFNRRKVKGIVQHVNRPLLWAFSKPEPVNMLCQQHKQPMNSLCDDVDITNCH